MNLKRKTAVFVKGGLLRFKEVGTIAPLGKSVSKEVASLVGQSAAPRLAVELGVGVGSLTSEILRNLGEKDFFLGLDSNKEFAEICRAQVSGKNAVIENALAQDILAVMKKHGFGEADIIISSLPFRIFSKETRKEILSGVKTALKTGGRFLFVRYLVFPETKDIFEILNDFKVTERKSVWSSFPPVEIIEMKKN